MKTNHDQQAFPTPQSVYYITTEFQANEALRPITTGPIGFDTEYTKRRPTLEEELISDAISAGATRKTAILGWQIVELETNQFSVAWNNIGLRTIQLAKGNEAWVLDMWKIKAFPTELRRILTSPDIAKVGVGLTSSNIGVIWDDLRTEMKMLVDAGLMAKLYLVEKHEKGEELLGYNIKNEESASEWAADELSAEQKNYTAIDAAASLRLYEYLALALKRRNKEIDSAIPRAWYTFSTKMGEPTRLKRGPDGAEMVWRTSDCTWDSTGNL
ncbi:ribonuclease H-like domain-containing protein [Mycena leptocephala]|nr:ribonuclease H-like domain-containing protein [Mycena leptocephala]